jgi:putative transposase
MELPSGDSDFSTRVGKIKSRFTRQLGDAVDPMTLSASRSKRHERAVWQRRFWEHTIRDDRDLEAHVESIHYNPVKHGHASCPHAWAHSSFHRWVRKGRCRVDWACTCNGRCVKPPNFGAMAKTVGE